MSLLTELEDFINGHKARSVNINIDDGYGSTFWFINITTEKGTVKCIESPWEPWDEIDPSGDLMGLKYIIREGGRLPIYTIYATEEGSNDWCGLRITLEKALGFAKTLVNQ